MARETIRPTTAERNKRLRDDYDSWHGKGFRHDAILKKLADSYCLTERSVIAVLYFEQEKDQERTQTRKDQSRGDGTGARENNQTSLWS